MQKFTTVTAPAVPLRRSAVDTDQIIPAVYLKRVTKTGFEDALFASWRSDPDFVLNNPGYSGAKILVAGSDFGCGSSREHAVWALRDYGFDVVLAPTFADIFRGNAGKQGLLTATISEAAAEEIWDYLERVPGARMSVDLLERTATLMRDGDERVVPIEVDDYTRWRLLEGLDDIALTLRDEDAISAFEARRESWRPTTLPARHA